MLRIGTKEEFNRLSATSGAQRGQLNGKRYTVVTWSLCGVVLCEKTQMYSRNKPEGEPIIMVNPDYLPKPEAVAA